MTWALGIFGAWLVFNWLAPLSLLAFAEPMSVGRLPKDILEKANAYRVRFYIGKLPRSAALSSWLGWKHVVVMGRDFMAHASPAQVRFVLAHELGHCALGHLKRRWFCTVTGLALVPAVGRYLRAKEEEADAWAEELSGIPRGIMEPRQKA